MREPSHKAQATHFWPALPDAAIRSSIPVKAPISSSKPTIHRFYDTSPISPSGRFLAVTELPYDDRLPSPGDEARIVVVDLGTGREVYSSNTVAWDTQVGAHVQWGGADGQLFFNRLDTSTWRAHGVCVDPATGAELELPGTVYMVSPDGRMVASPDLHKIALVQAGYGLNIPDVGLLRHTGAPDDEGLFVTDVETRQSRLLVSMQQVALILEEAGVKPDLHLGGLYGFHVKWNPQGTRLMFLVRWLSANTFQRGTLNYLLTVDSDGSNLRLALDAKRWAGGHHPNWCPDGDTVVMNLRDKSSSRTKARVEDLLEKIARKLGIRYFSNAYAMRFHTFRYDGTDLKIVAGERYGSGHPTLSPDGRYLLTDAYLGERVAVSEDKVPLRWVNLQTGEEAIIAEVPTLPSYAGPSNELRVDPHPAWHRDGRTVVFNGYLGGVRQVLVSDFESLIEKQA